MVSGSRRILAAIALLAVPMLFPALIQAAGIGITPAFIEMNDALRGTEYQRTVILTNSEAAQVKFEFVPEGEAGEWAALYPLDGPDTPVTSFAVPPNSDVRLKVKLRIPKEAPNGLHTGRLIFRSAVAGPKGEGESSMAVSIGIGADLRIGVTGTQKIAGKVTDASLLDVEVDQPPLRLITLFQNTGNVDATPRIELQVKDEQRNVVGEATFGDVTVEPSGFKEIVSEWDHSGKPAGKYSAAVSVVLGTEKIYERELGFKMLPKGTITRVGKLDEIKLGSEPRAGGTVKLVGMFQNTGKIDTKAVLIAEIYRSSALLRQVESRDRVIPAGQKGEIELFFDIPDANSYTVKAKVNYEGKLTDTRELTFVATAPERTSTGTEGLTLALIIWLAAGLVTLMVSTIVGWILWRKRAEERALARRRTRFES